MPLTVSNCYTITALNSTFFIKRTENTRKRYHWLGDATIKMIKFFHLSNETDGIKYLYCAPVVALALKGMRLVQEAISRLQVDSNSISTLALLLLK